MKNITAYGVKFFHRFLITVCISFAFLAGAYAACCSGHGGVASCNKSTGFKMCKDGTASPSCTCPKAKEPKAKKEPKASSKASKAMSTPDTKATTGKTTGKTTSKTTIPTKTETKAKESKGSWWGGSSNKTQSGSGSKSNSGTSAKGCCSYHGGVSQCDIATGHQKCNDGTISASCACH